MKTNIKILGKKWRVKILTNRAFKNKHGKDASAMTIPDNRKIHFKVKKFNKEVVVHEFTHAYLHELCLSSAGDTLTAEALEEIYCEFMAYRSKELLTKATKLFNKITKKAK